MRSLLLVLLWPALVLADWKVTVDPSPTKPIVWPAKEELHIDAPKGFTEPLLNFADRGGGFVAITINDAKATTIKVYELLTSKKVGEVSVPQRMTKLALSEDGKMVAGYIDDFAKYQFVTYEAATGKQLASVPVDLGGEMITFVGNDKVAYRSRGGKDRDVHLIDANTGKELARFPTGILLDTAPAASCGGALLAITKQDGIVIHSTKDGSVVGELNTKIAPPDEKQKTYIAPLTCRGLAFSPDGTMLAAYGESVKPRILVWSMKDGQLLHDVVPDQWKMAFAEGPKMEWLPDNSGWLINGTNIVDRATGRTIWVHPRDLASRSARRALDAGTIVYLDSTNREARKLNLATMASEKIAAIRESLKTGGTAFDAALPKIVATDYTRANEVDVPLAGVAWAGTIDAAPATAAVARRPVPLSRKPQEIESLFVVGGAKPLALFDLGKRDNMVGPIAESSPRQLEAVDLTTGKVTTTLDLPAGCQVVAISGDGRWAVTRDMGTQQRLDVWSLEKKAHVVGWKPYDREAEANRKVTFVGLGETTIVTLNAVGQLVGWKLTDATPQYRAKFNALTAPTMSPAHKHLVAMQQGVVRFIDVNTGRVVGDLEPKAIGDFANQGPIGFRPDGGEVATLLRTGLTTLLVRWDAKGQRLEEVPYPGFSFGTPSLTYVDHDYLLLDNRDLYDIKRKAIVWRYSTGMGRIATYSPDGRIWYATQMGFDSPASLLAVTLPEDDVKGYVKEVVDGPNAILKPGTKVAIDLEVTGTHANKAKDATLDALKNQLKAAGLEYAANADLKLTMKISERKTGDTIEFRKLFSGFRDPNPMARLSVAEIEIAITTELKSGAEVIFAVPNQKIRMGEFFGIIRLPDADTNLTDYLYQQVWDKVPSRAAAMGMPRFLAKTPNGTLSLPGSTVLQGNGPTTLKPVVKP